jgi:putative endonuclease
MSLVLTIAIVTRWHHKGRYKNLPFVFMTHFVYILYSESADRFYVGETCNIELRIQQHNSGFYKSAFSKKASDWNLFWSVDCKSRTQALKIEKHIKKMRNRTFYQNLTKYPEMTEKLLQRFPE